MRFSKACLLPAFLFCFVTVTWSAAGMMSVQVKEGQLRSTPSFLGGIVGLVSYGDQVEVLQGQGEWLDVKDVRSQRGWIHQSALTAKKVLLNVGEKTASTAASGQELALAGKGFNAQVETQYRMEHKDADYAMVDRMENITVAPQEIALFLNEGAVKPAVGGGK